MRGARGGGRAWNFQPRSLSGLGTQTPVPHNSRGLSGTAGPRGGADRRCQFLQRPTPLGSPGAQPGPPSPKAIRWPWTLGNLRGTVGGPARCGAPAPGAAAPPPAHPAPSPVSSHAPLLGRPLQRPTRSGRHPLGSRAPSPKSCPLGVAGALGSEGEVEGCVLAAGASDQNRETPDLAPGGQEKGRGEDPQVEGRGGGLWPAHSLALPGAHPLRAPHGEGPNRCVLTEVTAGGWRRPADKKSCPGWVPALHAGQVSSCRLTCSDWDGMLENQAQGLPSLQTGGAEGGGK